MAIVQLRNDTKGRAYYRRKLAAGKTSMEAIRCLKRRLSDQVYRQMINDARVSATSPGGHTGTATGSSVADFNPSAGTSEKSLPGPATCDPTPARRSTLQVAPEPPSHAGPQSTSSAVCLTTARTGAHLRGGNNDPLDIEGSHEPNSVGGGRLRLADLASLRPPAGRTLAELRDHNRRTGDGAARDVGPDGNQPGNQAGNHAADLREDTPPVSYLLPWRKSQAQGAKIVSELQKHLSERIPVRPCPVLEERAWARIGITNMPLTCGYFTKWSYGDSNSGPLACHESLTHSLTRPYAA
jgi:hypothetical protein